MKDLKIDKNTAIYCPTEELANKVLSILHREECVWSGGDSLIEDNCWWDEKEATCYDVEDNKEVSLTSKEWYEENGYKIIPAQEFIKNNTEMELEEIMAKMQELAKHSADTLPYLALGGLAKLKLYNNIEMNKEIKVEIPEGMEVDLEKSVLNGQEVSIVYKAIKFNEDYVDVFNRLKSIGSLDKFIISTNQEKVSDFYCSDKQLLKLVAINNLQNIANYYNKGVEIDWKNGESKYFIVYDYEDKCFALSSHVILNLGAPCFINKEDAQSVIDNPNFRSILDKIYK